MSCARRLRLAARLLGTHVFWGTHRRCPVSVSRSPPAASQRQSDPEVGDQRLALVQQDVLRLDVAVDDPVRDARSRARAYLASDPHASSSGSWLHALAAREATALDERHDVEPDHAPRPRRNRRSGEDVRVRKPSGDPDLAEEAVAPRRRRTPDSGP